MPVIAFPLVSGIQNWNLHGCHCHPKRVLAHIPTWKKLKNHPVAGKFRLQPTPPPPLSYTQTHTSNPFSWGQRNPSGGMARRSGPSLKSRCFTQIESFGLREKKPQGTKGGVCLWKNHQWSLIVGIHVFVVELCFMNSFIFTDVFYQHPQQDVESFCGKSQKKMYIILAYRISLDIHIRTWSHI